MQLEQRRWRQDGSGASKRACNDQAIESAEISAPGAALQAERLDAKGVQRKATRGQRPEDVLHHRGALAATDRADTHARLTGEVDALRVIEGHAPLVVGLPPALEHRREGHLWGTLAQLNWRRAGIPRVLNASMAIDCAC